MARARAAGSSQFYEADWRLVIESHLVWLINNAKEERLNINPHMGWKYEGDFYGMLTEANVPNHLHYVILRMNGLFNPVEYDGTLLTILLPNEKLISNLSAMYQTTK